MWVVVAVVVVWMAAVIFVAVAEQVRGEDSHIPGLPYCPLLTVAFSEKVPSVDLCRDLDDRLYRPVAVDPCQQAPNSAMVPWTG